MRVVLDTNVFISGVFFGGPPRHILKAWRDGRIRVVLSTDILREYQKVSEVLSEQFPDIDLDHILDLFTFGSDIVSIPPLPEPVCLDPEDDKFVACAMYGGAEIVISGDKHLLKVNGYRGIQILRPREFVDRYLSE